MKPALSTTLKILIVSATLLGVTRQSVDAASPPAPAGMAIISGTVVDRDASVPIPSAKVTLYQGSSTTATETTQTDASGSFTFRPVQPATYVIVVQATGYGTVRSDPIGVGAGPLNVALIMQRQSSTGVHQLGRITVQSHASGLQTTTTIQNSASPQLAQRTNQIRMAETLGNLPEVNLVGLDSAVGDDISIDIRGLKPSETQVMLDGHPIGPLGVYPGDIGGGVGGFNFQDSPLFATDNTIVTYGSGATGLYGVDAVGGSVDMQTILPTQQAHGQLEYGLGSYGKQLFGAEATGSSDKLGYAVAYGVTGTYGNFQGAIIPQTGLTGTNFTSTNINGNTYFVSGNYNLRNGLVKVRYNFSPNTSLTLTGYTATSWDDKTGNGDNDFVTYDKALYNAQTSTNCTTSGGKPGITVTTNSGSSCVTPQQFAQTASGPAGGGGGAFQALANQDYHARFLESLGKNQIVIDGFVDNFSQNRQRSESYTNGPLNVLTNIYHTIGYLASDDLATGKNDFGAGVYFQRQYFNGNTIVGSAVPPVIPNASLFSKLNSYFIRDAYTASPQFSAFLNAWEKDSLIGGWSFDPRLSLVYRPTPADVVRVTGGAASADPAPIAVTITGAGGINQGNCQQFSLGTVPTPGVLPEKSTDEEVSLAHRESADTITEFTGYITNERNTIFEAQAPASGYIDLLNEFGGAGYIAAAIAHVTSVCPNFTPTNPATINNFYINSNVNLATARARGFELGQRLRVNDHLFFDGYWNTQSTTIFDAPASLLMNNPTLIPGSQLPKIPLHKWGVSLNATTNSGGELFLDYTQVDSNNELARPSYGSANLAITQQVAPRTFVNLGVSNLFNQAVDNYGRIGWGVYVPENQYGTDPNAVAQGSERFGLAPASVSFTVIERY